MRIFSIKTHEQRYKLADKLKESGYIKTVQDFEMKKIERYNYIIELGEEITRINVITHIMLPSIIN